MEDGRFIKSPWPEQLRKMEIINMRVSDIPVAIDRRLKTPNDKQQIKNEESVKSLYAE
jgi:hypothetical protein